uniref:Uncharacterized protein n=1 Tax=Ditylenchus dipsaci TaxID=166011 RepID=A0A915EC25_9BILA
MFLKHKSRREILFNILLFIVTSLCNLQLFTVDAQQVGANVNSAAGAAPVNVQAGPITNSAIPSSNAQTVPSSAVPGAVPVVNMADPSQVAGTNSAYGSLNYNPTAFGPQTNSNFQTNPSTYPNYQNSPNSYQTNSAYPGQARSTYPAQAPYPSNSYAQGSYQTPSFTQGYGQQQNYYSNNVKNPQNQPYNTNNYMNPPGNYISGNANAPNGQTGPYAPPGAFNGQNSYMNTNANPGGTGNFPLTSVDPAQSSSPQNYAPNSQMQGQRSTNYGFNTMANQQSTGYNPAMVQPNANYGSNPAGNGNYPPTQVDPTQSYVNGQPSVNNQNYAVNSQLQGQPSTNFGYNAMTNQQSGGYNPSMNQPVNYANGVNSGQSPASYSNPPQNTAYGVNNAVPNSNGYAAPGGIPANGMQGQNTNGRACLNQIDNNMCSQYAQQGLCAQYGPQCDAACLRC